MASLSPPPAPPVYSEISEKKLKSQPEATFRLFHDIVFTQRSVLPPPSFVSANILPALARHLKSAPPSGTKKNEIHVADLALDVVSVLPCSDELTEVLTTTYAQIPTPCIKAGVLRHLPVALTSPKLEEFVTKQLPSSYNKPATTPETCSLRRCEMTFLRRVASLGSSATASSSHALQLLIKGCDDKKNFESALEELGLVDYDDGLRKMVVDTRGKALEKLLENAIKICGELDKADKAPAKKTKGAAVTGGKKTATSSASSSSTPSGHIASLSSGVLSLSVLSLLSSTHLANSSSLVNDKKSFLHTTPSYHLSPLASPPALRAYTRILRRCAEGDLALRRLTIVAMEATDGDVRREGKRQLREVVATSMDKTITVVDTMFGNLLRASQAEKEEGQHWKTAKDNRVRIEPCDAGGSRYLTGWKEGQTDRVKKTARGISRDILKRKDATDTDTGTDTDTDTDTDRNLPPATFLLPFLDSSAKPLPTKHFRAAFSSIFGAESFSQTPFVDAVLQALKSSVLNSAASKFLQFACLEAENFEEGYDTLTDTNRHEFNSRLFAKSVAENLRGEVEETVSTLSEIPGEDAHLLKILEGRLYEGDAGNGNANSSVKENKNVKRDVKKKKNKGDFGAEAEEEEWARELEKEREKAKLAEANKEERIYSKEELQTIEKQSLTRKSIQAKLDKLTLLANAINSMCSASLSITNEILLPIFSPVILPLHCSAKNPIPFFLSPFSSTLNLLSDSILEMDPSASLPLSRALILSQNGHLPFQPASSSLVATVVSTLDDFSDALSPPSFAYVLPVLHSILNSRRTLPGCDGALRIMDRQKREEDSVRTHRYSVTSTLLTLLSFDRRMNFTNPTVSETLTNFFDLPGNEPTEEEISLLLSTSGVLHADSNVRSAALGALKNALKHHPTSQPHAEIFLTSFDDDEAIASLAATCEIKPSSVFISTFVQVLNNEQVCDEVKRSAAKAVAEIMRTQGVQNTIVILTENFLTFAPAEFDDDKKNDKKKSKKELEMQLMMGSNAKSSKEEGKDNGDKIQKRCSTLLALSSIGSTPDLPLATADTINLMTFLIDYGLCDPNETVRAASASAGQKIIATYGAPSLDDLLPLFEKVLSTGASLNSSQKINNTVAAQDHRKEGAVVLLGSGALHLHNENDSDKISATVDMLLGALKTPSESVQRSVADCLVPLCKKGDTGSRAESIVDGLMKDALRDDSLAVRRGSAYGVSAVVKGLGISSLKKYDIVTRLEEGCGKTNPMMKEGSLFCIELLCSRLGMLFEPYVKGLLPALLKCFGDGSDHVRDAASAASSLIMAKLSSHGVKLIMPSVLAAFEDNAWRTKQASIRMLGAMSNCAPKQLATCLPKIVPALTQAFGDTHPKVKESAETALKQIKNVIRNPEIKTLAPVLLKGLTDPAKSTKKALDALLETEFLHAIDAPSLALLIPILQRGLKDRVGTSKRKSALVCGSMCTMIAEPRDFSPYLGVLLPGLQSVLLDPIPDVRSTSAKAIGALVRGLGESEMPDLRAWLIETLKSESGTSVERSGAAQGLCELLIACGGTTVHEVMKSEILPLSTHPRGNVREGVLWVLTFLPTSLGNGFASLIDDALPAVLTGLNDEVEPVREVAMRAGKVLIRSHGRTSVGQIVPPLEEGMEDPNWRIRQSSLMLLGDLLTMIGGTNVVGVAEIGGEDDTRGAEKAQAQIALVLGSETRKRVLSKLYIARSDTSSVVRQGAVQVWKSIVSVTPRTLREILPLLVSHIVISLSGGGDQSGSEDRTIVASRCLGDLVKKLGEKVLPEIIPILTNKLNDVEKETRMGVCIGLGEVISCGNKEQIVKYLDVLIPAVRASLVDAEDSVRKVGALAFQKLYSVIGGERVFTDIVPVLMSELDEEEEGGSLEGLKEVLKLKSKELLPMLIPKLLVHPITRTNAIVLENICEVTGGTIHFHFGRIVAEITTSISEFDGSDEPREESIKNAFRSACRNVDSTGINWLCSELATRCSSDKAAVRRAAIWMVGAFAEERKFFSRFVFWGLGVHVYR